MIKIGIDFDDVLAPYTQLCVDMQNKDHGTHYTINDINKWGTDGNSAIRAVSRYYGKPESYHKQKVSDEAKSFMAKLRKIADVYIITAMPPLLMSLRAEQIMDAFPDFPADHILMGSAKNLVQFDITLDDGPHNILKSGSTYPVLFRKPWNHDLSGVLTVNTYDEFLVLVDQVKTSMIEGKKVPEKPCVIALVGPSGSCKKQLRKELSSTIAIAVESRHVDEIDPSNSVETITDSIYGGTKYTMIEKDISKRLNAGYNVVCAVDMCGALTLKRTYPTIIVFCKRSRELMIHDVISRQDMSDEEKTLRILSMEQELRNEKLCDFSVRTENVSFAAKQIEKLLQDSM